MATNSGRGNPIAAADGPKGGAVSPPPVTSDVKNAVKDAAGQSAAAAGEHASGQDAGMPPAPSKVETEKEPHQTVTEQLQSIKSPSHREREREVWLPIDLSFHDRQDAPAVCIAFPRLQVRQAVFLEIKRRADVDRDIEKGEIRS
ncbi:hypothetical protein F5Y16DRAFT_397270 [Xylariaceae sp. FL0255]|nr:hypothetical protein F5Y16DRAFT_397270 [Xylariaceae sp. FL0255]